MRIWESFPSILEAMSKLIGMADIPSEDVVVKVLEDDGVVVVAGVLLDENEDDNANEFRFRWFL